MKNFRNLIPLLACLLASCHPRVQDAAEPVPEPLPPLGF